MDARRFLLICALSFAALVPAAARERVALVIGNGKYVHAGELPNPANDARAMTQALRSIGFEVADGIDLDRDAMERLIRDFLRKSSGAKVAILFYAGHGMQIDGRNYLVPIDAKLEVATDLNFETIDLDRLLDSLNDPQRATVVMLDACRDNPLARSFASRLGASRSAAVGTGLAAYTNPGTGTLIAFATAPGKVALDGQGTNSPFTTGLVRHLRTPGLEIRQFLTRVRKDVSDITRGAQVPWDSSSLLGDVYLAGLDPAARPPNIAPPQPALPQMAPPPRQQSVLPPAAVRSISTRGYNGSQYVEAEFRRDDAGNWIETQRTDASTRLRFAEQKNTATEVLLYDDLRDLYLRFDITGKRLYFRRGSGAWVPFYKIERVSATSN
ncbi:caspase family protein [Pseudorhodoplanes sp.]|uniref:caspase family protein n=1 Tax=Pseudorhodoplanes sp. TaxID=1934341 RepID=UPI003D0A86BE